MWTTFSLTSTGSGKAMPTFERTQQFKREYQRLSDAQQLAFKGAVLAWAHDLKANGIRPTDPRVSGIRGAPGTFEFRWAPDGRATFQWGPELIPGEPHVVWPRIGTHAILNAP